MPLNTVKTKEVCMTDGIDINILTGKAKDIALNIDAQNVKDNKLSDKEISIFLSECEKNGVEVKNEPWYTKCGAEIDKQLTKLKSYILPRQQEVAARDATRVEEPPEVRLTKQEEAREAKLKIHVDNVLTKEEICSKMFKKWSSKFKNSPLTESFYLKLYDVIDTLNVEIPESDWDRENYSSPKEQAMDEVIAIFAGESKLNPKSKNGIYNGLFQLANAGLTEAKRWAKKNSDVPGMKNISDSMTINKFRNSSGELQLDYLVAYIGKCKEYSKIGKDEKITPGQLWAMIKYPFKGKNNKLVQQKTDSIANVFNNSKIQQGIKT